MTAVAEKTGSVEKLRTAAKAARLRSRQLQVKNRRLIQKVVANRQFLGAEREVTKALIPFFVEQGRSMVSRLRKLEEKSVEDLREKHGDHDQSTHGRGGGGGESRGAEEEWNRGTEENPIEVESLRNLLTPSGPYGRLGTEDIGGVVVKGYRVGVTDDEYGRGVFYAGDRESAQAYAFQHEGEEVQEYTLVTKNTLLAGHQNDVTMKFFHKTYGEMVDRLSYSAGSEVSGGQKLDVKIAKESRKRGYDSIIYMKPAPPAKTEVAIFPPKKRKGFEKHGSHDQSTHGRGGGGGWERLRDRIEGTQAEADLEVKKASAEIDSVLDELDSVQGEKKSWQKAANPPSARALISLIFDPKEWRSELTNRVLPVLARRMAEAGVAHLMTYGVDVRRKRVREKSNKATTASDWAEENTADWESLIEAFESSDLPLGIVTEVPDWMQKSIAKRLTESFSEDYWDSVSQTTMGDAERVLRKGLAEGWSIDKMARELRDYYEEGGLRYARRRSENIARTECGNALNAARKDSVAQLQRELGPQVPMKQSWLSVLGNTTRATHADLDGVAEDENGMWTLIDDETGEEFIIPWPAHTSLSARQRCSCQCSVSILFGIDEVAAQELIDDYWVRVQE